MNRDLSNVLALEALSHGTDPISNLKIRFLGGQPSKADFPPNYKNTAGYFFVYKDSEFNAINGKEAYNSNSGTNKFERWCRLQNNSLTASYMQYHRYYKKEVVYGKPDKLALTVAAVGNILSPSIYFHFSKIDPNRFEKDTNFTMGEAYKTRQVVEP
ncbi:MAG: hypothetical protein JSS09_05355 [Verrucomicrobia bacterium]|nr:hypothetical protein [Verrucomicrobiota bacterium]